MAIIQELDQNTIDQIAAGEVVERPSSVVKELVENAIDSGATSITVEIQNGGTSLIRITDNGCGIEKNQIRNAFKRHATSKLMSIDDLFTLKSLGFRGEALSSIAAVSQVELITKTADELVGTRYVINGGNEESIEEIGAPTGTTIIVRDLFFNTPARKKFLKTNQTEGSYVGDLMEHMALDNPSVSFRFINNKDDRFSTSGNGDLKELIYRIYGRDVSLSLVPISVTEGDMTIEGYLGEPALNRSNRNFEVFFINGRYVKDKVVSKALEEGYKEYLMQHKFPFCVVHIRMDTAKVDVNVHPAKMEVRFSNQPVVYEFIRKNIAKTLHDHEMIPEVLRDEKEDAKD
nr:DNA mismatch repair endonuclease MutL [Butyrivibrio sp.]